MCLFYLNSRTSGLCWKDPRKGKKLKEFFKDLYNHSPKKFVKNIILMILSGITGGIGFLMLVPLFSIAGITQTDVQSISFLNSLSELFLKVPEDLRLIFILMIYVLIITVQVLFNKKMTVSNTQLTNGYMKENRQKLYDATIKARWQLLLEKNISDLTNTFSQEINKISMGSIFFLRIISQIIIGAVQITLTFLISWQLSVFVLICGLFMYIFVHPMIKRSKNLGYSIQKNNKTLMKEISEQLNGIKEVKSYGMEDRQIKDFDEITEKIKNNMIDFARLQAKPEIFYKIGAAIIISVFFYFSINTFRMDIASTIVILLIFSRLWPLFSSFQNNLQNIYVAIPSFKSYKRILRELEENKEIINSQERKEIEFTDSITFENVSFKYENNDSFELKNLNFQIKKNTITTIVGESGAGKSTIVDMIMGFLKPESGIIKIDNQVLDDSSIASWRKKIAYVSQTPFLFSGTVEENLRKFNTNVSQKQMWEALEKASAMELVKNLPDKLNTLIGDKGYKISGGERQRIVLARALLREPELLILDEATNSLDCLNRGKIIRSIESLNGTVSIILIHHDDFDFEKENVFRIRI